MRPGIGCPGPIGPAGWRGESNFYNNKGLQPFLGVGGTEEFLTLGGMGWLRVVYLGGDCV